MLDRRTIEEEHESLREALRARNHDFDVDALLTRLALRRDQLGELEQLQARRNAGSKEVGALFKAGKQEEGNGLRADLAELGKTISEHESRGRELEAEIHRLLLQIPNLVASDVPVGASEDDNVLVRTWGEPR